MKNHLQQDSDLKTFTHPVFGAIYLKVSKVAQTSESLSSNFSLACGGSDGKESACNAEDPGSVLGLGRSLGEEDGYPLQYACLENPMDRGSVNSWENNFRKGM